MGACAKHGARARASFVGEESGGAYHGNSFGSGATLVLPNSGLRVIIPLMTYTLAVSGVHPNGRGVIPESVSMLEIGDYLGGKDLQMETALLLAHAQRVAGLVVAREPDRPGSFIRRAEVP